MDGKDDGALVPLSECVQRLNDVLGIVRVESGGGFVEEQDGRSGHELARDGHTAFLAARDASFPRFANPRVLDPEDPELVHGFECAVDFGVVGHFAGETEEGGEEDGFVDGQGGEEGVFLVDVPDDAAKGGSVGDGPAVEVCVAADLAGFGFTCENVEQGGFAGARGAHNG